MKLPRDPKFKRGDAVRIPAKTPGHEHHDQSAAYIVTRVYPGKDAKSTSYELQHLSGLWPETRLVG